MYFTLDSELVICADEEVNGPDPLVFGPTELCGFGLGSFSIGTRSAVDSNKCIEFTINDDLAKLVIVQDGESDDSVNKIPLTVSEAIAKGLEENNLGDLGIQFHRLTDKTRTCGTTGEQITIRLRYNIEQCAKTVIFEPDRWSEADTNNKSVKRNTFGGCWSESFLDLPNGPCEVLWECETRMSSPPEYKPMKPKLWFTATTTLKPGVYYRVGE